MGFVAMHMPAYYSKHTVLRTTPFSRIPDQSARRHTCDECHPPDASPRSIVGVVVVSSNDSLEVAQI
jgi:hypothetical protein